MKLKIVTLLTLLVIACTSNNNTDVDTTLVGKWKLIEQLVDPGYGSGTFHPVSSNSVVEFFSDGTVTVNGEFCCMSTEVGAISSANYQETDDNMYFDCEILPAHCEYSETKVY